MERWIEHNLRWVLLAPTVIILLVLTAFPTVYIFAASVTKVNISDIAASEFVGLENFLRLVGDDKFHNALLNTVVFTTIAVAIEFGLGLGLALLLDRFVRRFGFIKTIILIPMMLPPIAIAITWRLIYQPQFGVLNYVLGYVGVPPQLWTSGVDTAMVSIILVDVWQWTPFVFLMMLAGLASLPSEPYEAADLDGANAWQKFRDLTWTFLKPIVTVTLLLRVMDAFRIFDHVFVLTNGGPAGATETLSYYIYKVAFRFFDIGYAAVLSLFMLFATTILSTWFIRRMQREGQGAA